MEDTKEEKNNSEAETIDNTQRRRRSNQTVKGSASIERKRKQKRYEESKAGQFINNLYNSRFEKITKQTEEYKKFNNEINESLLSLIPNISIPGFNHGFSENQKDKSDLVSTKNSKVRMTGKKRKDSDLENPFRLFAYFLTRAFGIITRPIGTAIEAVSKATKSNSVVKGIGNILNNTSEKLANVKTKIITTLANAPGAKTVTTVAGTALKTADLVSKGVSNVAKSSVSAIPITLLAAAASGGNPIIALTVAAGATGLNFTNNITKITPRTAPNISLGKYNVLDISKSRTLYTSGIRKIPLDKRMIVDVEKLLEVKNKNTIIANNKIFGPILKKALDFKSANAIRIARLTRAINWGGIGGAIGMGLFAGLGGSPLIGAGIGVGAGLLAQAGMEYFSPSLGAAGQLGKILGSVGNWGMSYIQLAQSHEWAIRFLRTFREKGFNRAWVEQMWGLRGVLNIANIGFYASSLISTRAIGSAVLAGVSRATSIAGVSSELVTAGIGQIGLNSTGSIIGGIAGTGLGFALAGGGGGAAFAAAVTAGAIGGVIGSILGAAFGPAGSFIGRFLGVGAGNFLGNFFGSIVGTKIGQGFESVANGAANFANSFMTLSGLMSAIKGLDLNSGWGIEKMLMMAIAFMQIITIIENGVDGQSFLRIIKDDEDDTSSIELILSQEKLKTFTNELENFYFDPKETITASSELDTIKSINSKYILVESSGSSEKAREIVMNLKKGYSGFYNRRGNFTENISDFNECISTIRIDCYKYFDTNMVYSDIDLVKEIYNLDNIKNYNDIIKKYADNIMYLNEINNFTQINSGDIAIINDGGTKTLGIIDKVTKDYIKIYQSNSLHVEEYFTLNYFERNITTKSYADRFIESIIKVDEN